MFVSVLLFLLGYHVVFYKNRKVIVSRKGQRYTITNQGGDTAIGLFESRVIDEIKNRSKHPIDLEPTIKQVSFSGKGVVMRPIKELLDLIVYDFDAVTEEQRKKEWYIDGKPIEISNDPHSLYNKVYKKGTHDYEPETDHVIVSHHVPRILEQIAAQQPCTDSEDNGETGDSDSEEEGLEWQHYVLQEGPLLANPIVGDIKTIGQDDREDGPPPRTEAKAKIYRKYLIDGIIEEKRHKAAFLLRMETGIVDITEKMQCCQVGRQLGVSRDKIGLCCLRTCDPHNITNTSDDAAGYSCLKVNNPHNISLGHPTTAYAFGAVLRTFNNKNWGEVWDVAKDFMHAHGHGVDYATFGDFLVKYHQTDEIK